jgi:hypothetical protein
MLIKLLKSSREIIGVNVEIERNVSEISSVSIIRVGVDVDPDDGDRGYLWNVGF